MADINIDGVKETSELLKARCQPSVGLLELKVDVSDLASVEAMVRKTMEKFGGLDYGILSLSSHSTHRDSRSNH